MVGYDDNQLESLTLCLWTARSHWRKTHLGLSPLGTNHSLDKLKSSFLRCTRRGNPVPSPVPSPVPGSVAIAPLAEASTTPIPPNGVSPTPTPGPVPGPGGAPVAAPPPPSPAPART